jgi:phosphoribosyl 1,2-cyclic phosphodiesterase
LLRFTSLASGSGGNATLIEGKSAADPDDQPPTRLLVDCGLAPKRLAAALALRGLAPADLDAIFVTHEHSDHVGGVIALQRRHGITVWASAGTWAAATARRDGRDAAPAQFARHAQEIAIGALVLMPFSVPHDAAEPLQLVVRHGASRIGIVTDLGEPTNGVASALQGCDALLLECNHDRERLANGAYPAWLKRRIGGARGHLSNDQSAALLDACRHDGLRHVVAAHLSRQNNEPALALAALRGALANGLPFGTPALHVAGPQTGCGWIEID